MMMPTTLRFMSPPVRSGGALPASSARDGGRLTVRSGDRLTDRFSTGGQSGDDGEVPGGLVQADGAIIGDGHLVLDADAEPALEVDAGLDGEAHAGLQGQLVPLD